MTDAMCSPQCALRQPSEVMRLARMGQAFPTRLSFLRVLLRRLKAEKAEVKCPVWRMDGDGFGEAVYTVVLDGKPISLVAISRALADADRSDRVIANAWDAAFVLYDGVPDDAEIARLGRETPLQEAGRFCERDLVLSRANKSVRVWRHVVEALKAGRAPDPAVLGDVGYLMRTTAVYGNGKFGIADRFLYAGRPALSGPFAAEMLAVWLIRQFTFDLVEHVGGAQLPPDLKRGLGVGNATGLGMAPFLVSHPVLLHNWMAARETALARVRAAGRFSPDQKQQMLALHARAAAHLQHWQVPDKQAASELKDLIQDWQALAVPVHDADMAEDIFDAAQTLGLAAQELTVSFLIEIFPDLVDDLTDQMADPGGKALVLLQDTKALSEAIARDWEWAQGEYAQSAAQRFWYISANKLEPRIGDRWNEPGAECERPLDVARSVALMQRDLPGEPESTCDFLQRHPEHAFAAERVSTLAQHPYAEIRDNLIDAACRPIDMLRCKLAFFGATRFDPKSDLWTRITLAQGAPLAGEIATHDEVWLSEGLA